MSLPVLLGGKMSVTHFEPCEWHLWSLWDSEVSLDLTGKGRLENIAFEHPWFSLSVGVPETEPLLITWACLHFNFFPFSFHLCIAVLEHCNNTPCDAVQQRRGASCLLIENISKQPVGTLMCSQLLEHVVVYMFSNLL